MITTKKIFTLCLLLVLLSMASVNAVDDNMTIQTGDSSNELITKNEADIPDVKSDYTEEDPLSFEYLQRDIDNASEGDEIELNNDYSLEEGGTTITIFKSITINGNNHTISGNYQDRILSISTGVKKVVLKNIILEEANTTRDGGAIYNPNSETSIDLINCVIQYNTASNTYRDGKSLDDYSKTGGGAVYSTGNINIINSEFRENTIIIGRGAAIYCGGKLVVNNSSFSDNLLTFGTQLSGMGSGLGGAIYSIGTCTIDNSYFHHNSAGMDYDDLGTYGGAVYCRSNVYVYNTEFLENEARCESGGAIYSEKDLHGYNLIFTRNTAYCGGATYTEGKTYIYSSKFSENKHIENTTHKDKTWQNPFPIDPSIFLQVDPSEGGAIYSTGNCFIDSCIFDGNIACEIGGAIYTEGDLNITGQNSFSNNQAARNYYFDLNIGRWRWVDKRGGAIYCKGHTYIENTNFTDNNAFVDGGAIYGNGMTEVINCNFQNNKALGIMARDPMGGAIRSKGTLVVDNCNFEKNLADSYGGAIYADGYTAIYDSTFKNNMANDGIAKSHGGAIYAKDTLKIENSEFENNHVDNYGGAIYACDDTTITNCSFNSNKVTSYDGGAIYSEGKIIIVDSQFKNNKVIGSNIDKSYGGAVRSEDTITIENSAFENNHSNRHGGAVYASKDVTITDSSFNSNDANGDGGAVYCDAKTSIYNSIFTNNKVLGKLPLERSFGGAVLSNGLITVKNSVFEDNDGHNQGGAIYANNEIRITGSNFTDNTANQAGAVYTSTITQKVTDSIFKNNKATTSPGGAIYINNKCNPEFSYCTFEKNTCNDDGGAIYFDSSRGTLKVSSCTFNGNTADVDGGAIYSPGETVISSSKFYNNRATGKTSKRSFGGAIRSDGLITVTDSYFGKNYADNYGGAIYADGEIRISGSQFPNNSAKNKGGAIYTSTIKKTVTKSTFIGNEAKTDDGGAIYISSNCNPEFISCRFESNVCKEQGGAIYLDKSFSHLTMELCTFVDNYAGDSGQSVYNCGYFDLVDRCWFGKNNPKLKDQFKIWHKLKKDEDFYPTTVLSIAMKIDNTTDIHQGIPYKVNVYFYYNYTKSGKIVEGYPEGDILHSNGKFYGNGTFSNAKVDLNNITADVVFNMTKPAIQAKLDYQWLSLNPDVKDKTPSTVRIILCNNVRYPDTLKVGYEIFNMADQAVYKIETNYGMLYKMGVITKPKSTLIIPIDLGEYSITITNPETQTTKASSDTAKFMVYQVVSANVTADNVVYGNPTTVTLNADYDGLYDVQIDDTVLKMKVENGTCVQQVKLDAGQYQTITQSNKFVTLKVNEALFTVDKAINNVVLDVENVTYGEESVVTIIADADGDYQLNINGTNYTAHIFDGITYRVVRLNAGEYSANVTFDNKNYNTHVNNTTFSVYKADVDLAVVVFDEVYPDKVECIVYADKDGEYNLTIADHTTTITVKDNIAYYEHKTLDAGNYEATVSFNGDENHNPASNKTTFTVYPQNTLFEIEVNPVEVTYSESATVTHNLTTGATGTIKYYLYNNTYLDELDVNDNLTLPVLNVGKYHVIAQYLGDKNHISANDSTFFTVKPATNNVVVTVENVTYGLDSIITVSADVDGNYSVDVNNTVITVSVNNGVGNKSIKLNVGEYYANVTFNHENYITIAHNTTFSVFKAINNVVINVTNVTYGEESVMLISADADGVYNVDVNGTNYDVSVVNGVGNKSIRLNAGIYHANVRFDNEKYDTQVNNTVFTVYKADVDLSVVVFDEMYPDEIECIVYASRDGEYNLTIADHTTTITVKDNIAYYEHKTLDAGTYQAIVSFNGDNNYNPAFNITTFSVYPFGTLFEVYVNPGEVIYGQTAVVSHKLSDGATGSIKYYLNSNIYLDELDVKDNLTLPVLNVGNYVIIASYSGDYDYIPVNDSTHFIVEPAINNVIVNANNVTYGEHTLIELTASVDGDYTVDVNGKIYNITVKDGVGNKTLSLDAGSYYANVTFNNKNYITNVENTIFTVNKAPNNIKVTAQNVTYGKETTIEIRADVDGHYQLDVNKKTYDITVNHGVGNKTIRLNAGNYYANVTFDNKNYNTNADNTIFTVYKADVDLVVAVFDEVYPDEIECIVYASRDGEYNLTIADHTTTITVQNNLAYYEHKTLNAGNYEATVSYNGDENHKPASNKTTFTVYPQNTLFEIEVNPGEVIYGETATVTHNLTTGATGTIKYYLSNGTFLDELDVNNNLTLPVLNVGSNVIIAIYSGDKNHISANDSTSLKVKAANNNVIVNANNVTYGENTLIEIMADVDGVYKLDVNGKLYNITTNNGVGNKTLSLNAGIYYANVTLDNKNYNSTYHNTNFKVFKANTNIEIVASDITYPQELEGTIQSDVDGKYYLTEGNYSIPVIVNDSKGSFNLGVLDTGSYNIVVNYSGDNNHNPATRTKLIHVNPAINNAIVMVNNVTYGEDTLIEVSADVDGTYQVDINQTVYDVCIINGTGNITVTLNAGIYYANISYNNKNYNTISHNSNFEVYKACTNIFVVSPNIFYSEELEGYVYSNVDGMYNLSVANYSTVINITDGIGEFNAGIFEAGEYMVSVSYDGDENHYANTSSNDVVVEKLIPEINLEASDINYGEVEIINITCTVPGSVNVTVNNITKTLKLKSQSNEDSIEELNDDSMNYYATMSLYDLNSGTYPVMVVYNGDKNIECVNTTGEFKVNVLNVTMDIESYDIYVGEDEKITVKLSSEVNGTVNITVDESTHSQTVKDAKAIIIIPDLTAGEKIAEVYYSGDNNHNPVTDHASFTVNKKESVITLNDHISYIGENITFTAKITDNDKKCVNGGKVVFKLNDVTLKDAKGEPIYTTVEDGIASISYYIPTSFHAKNYKITAVYGGNDEYLGSRNNASLQLLSRLAQLTLATNEDVKAGQTINFHVTVTDQMDTNRKVNGNVIFKINGITLKDENEETLQVEIIDNTADYFYTIGPDFPARQHTITSVLINRSYVRSQTENQFNVKTTEITINLNNITTNTQTAQLTGTITDTTGKNVIGTNKLAIKIDGITIKNEDNTTQIYYANDGIINITLKTDKYKIGKHIIEVVTPARSSYTQARKNTTLTITNITNTSTISKQAKTTNKTTTTTITNNTTNYNKIHNDEKQNIKKSTNIDTKSNINTNYNTIKSYKTNKNTFNTFENKKLSDKGNAKPDTYVTLAWLKDIFKDDFKNKTLLIYIDNILVYNATTSNDNSEILFKVLEQYEGKHLLKVVEGNESYEKEVNLI